MVRKGDTVRFRKSWGSGYKYYPAHLPSFSSEIVVPIGTVLQFRQGVRTIQRPAGHPPSFPENTDLWVISLPRP